MHVAVTGRAKQRSVARQKTADTIMDGWPLVRRMERCTPLSSGLGKETSGAHFLAGMMKASLCVLHVRSTTTGSACENSRP